MALLFMDSFDHYATADLTTKWTSAIGASIQTTTGRRSSGSLRTTSSTANVSKGLTTSSTTMIIGVALNMTALGMMCLALGENTATHIALIVNGDGSLSVGRATFTGWSTSAPTTLCTSAAGLISTAVYNFLELKVVIADSGGSVVLRCNNLIVASATGVDTRNSGATGVANIVYLGGNANFDDLYVLDGIGSAPWQDFLGDCRVDARFPTAAGATTGWTPSTGSNWQNVDDAAPNGDTDYNTATAAALTDTFVVQDAPVAGAAIYGVQHNLTVKKMDAGAATLAPVIRHSGTDNVGADLAPGTAYGMGLQVNQTNPGTGAQWTEAGFNAAEFGYKKTL